MKVVHLFESANSLLLRRIALRLQAELQENQHLGSIIENIELNRGAHRPNMYDELITLHMTGPLFELSLDISYYVLLDNDGNSVGDAEWTIEARTNKVIPGDGIHIANASIQPDVWFTADRVVKFLIKKKPSDTDVYRHNYLWFDKIARDLDKKYQFFLKNTIVDKSQIMTSQILENSNIRFVIEFCHHPVEGFCYRLGPFHHLGLRADDMRIVNNFSGINEILSGDDK